MMKGAIHGTAIEGGEFGPFVRSGVFLRGWGAKPIRRNDLHFP